MATSQHSNNSTKGPATEGNESANEPAYIALPQHTTLPSATLEVFGIVGEETLAECRVKALTESLPEDHTKKSEVDSFQQLITDFKKASQKVAQLDKQSYQKGMALASEALQTVSAIHDFARQFLDPAGTASKSMLLESIKALISDLHKNHEQFDATVASGLSQKPTLSPPTIRQTKKGEVLDAQQESSQPILGEPQSLQLNALCAPQTIATISTHSYSYNPHAHLLVDAHYVISSEGLRQQVPSPTSSELINSSPGSTTVTLQFHGLTDIKHAPCFPKFGIRDFRYHRTQNGALTTGLEITYTASNSSEDVFNQGFLHDRAEICVPEIFSSLMKKCGEVDISDREKAQLIAQAFASQNLVYCRNSQIAELLSSCDPKHSISFVLGLGMGDCALFSATLQQLLVHAGLNAVIEAGAVCSPDGKRYEYPGHARVAVYCEEETIRLDPTLWTTTPLNTDSLTPEILSTLKTTLLQTDAASAFAAGQKVRELLEEASKNVSGKPGTDDARSQNDLATGGELMQSGHGHRLTDDFNQNGATSLYRLLASDEQESLVADVWDAYYTFFDVIRDMDMVTDPKACEFLNSRLVAILEKEVELVGVSESKLCSLIPQMLQEVCSTRELDCWGAIATFVGDIASLETRCSLLSHLLHPTTAGVCIFTLREFPQLPTSDDAALFLERVFALLSSDFFQWRYGDGEADFAADLIRLVASFPEKKRHTLAQGLAEWLTQGNATSEEILLRLETWHKDPAPTMFSPFTVPRDVLTIIFPALEHSPAGEAEKLLAFLRDRLVSSEKAITEKVLDDYLISMLVLCGYFDSRHYPELQPIISEYIASIFKDSDARCIDWRHSSVAALLCELTYLDDQDTSLNAKYFVTPKDFYRRATNMFGYRMSNEIPKQDFFRGYILKALHSAGLIDPERIEKHLYSPDHEQIDTTFKALHLANNSDAPFGPNFGNPLLAKKQVEIWLATLYQQSIKGVSIPHFYLIKEAVTREIISPDIVELTHFLSRDKQQIHSNDQIQEMSSTIASCLRYVHGLEDALHKRSTMRLNYIFGILEGLPNHREPEYSEKLIDIIALSIIENDSNLRQALYDSLEECFLYSDPDLKLLFHAIRNKPVTPLHSWEAFPRDMLRIALQRALNAPPSELFKSNPLLRRRHATVNLLQQFATPDGALPIIHHTRKPQAHRWRAAVVKNLQLQKTVGATRLLRKISASRNTNFDALRPYVPGDELKIIDWKASARRDDLVVRSYQEDGQSIANSFHIILDIADLVNRPHISFDSQDALKYDLSPVELNTAIIKAASEFLTSLAREEKEVHVSLFAWGSCILETRVLGARPHSKTEGRSASEVLTLAVKYAHSYGALCNAAQCIPDALQKYGVMNQNEQELLLRRLLDGSVVMHLHGNASAKQPLDSLILRLSSQGRAARLNIEQQ